MTTFDPGARVVLTHGLRDRPSSTAFFASSAAPIITDGFDVLVQDVIAAMVTAPWSSSTVSPVDSVGRTGLLARPETSPTTADTGWSAGSSWVAAGGSEAGKDSCDASSALPPTP